MSKFTTAIWTLAFALLALNTWVGYERIKSQKELNGTVLAFKRVLEAKE